MKHITLALYLIALVPCSINAATRQIIKSEKVTFSLEEITDGLA